MEARVPAYKKIAKPLFVRQEQPGAFSDMKRYFPQAADSKSDTSGAVASTPTYEVWRQLFEADVRELSSSYTDYVKAQGNEEYDHGGRPWRASVSYIDAGKIKNEALGACFQPLIDKTMPKLEESLGIKLRCESAFANLYDADAADGEVGMPEHRDHDNGQKLVEASVICQGYTTGFTGGGLNCRDPGSPTCEHVDLVPGDCLYMRGTWHQPCTITSGQRLAFILFFHRLDDDTEDVIDGGVVDDSEWARSVGFTRRLARIVWFS
jgi:hypothetical protein